MTIKSVELINDYEIDLNSGAFNKIKSNNELMDYLTDDSPIEDESDIVTIDLAEACEELKLDLKTYFNEFDVIRIVEEGGRERLMTNLEIAPLWEWHEFADEMVCNWHGDYLMLTASDRESQSGLMAIYDVSKKEWIFSDIEAFMRGMIYAEEINKFIGLYNVKTKGYSEIGITIIDPEGSFSDESITFEASSGDKAGETDIQDFTYKFDDKILESDDMTGTVIDDETALLWNGKEKCCHIRIEGKGYMYCF